MTVHPLHHLIVGIGQAGESAPVLLRAIALADQLAAQLSIVHAVEIPPAMWIGITEEQLASMHSASLAAARERVLDTYGAVLTRSLIHI